MPCWMSTGARVEAGKQSFRVWVRDDGGMAVTRTSSPSFPAAAVSRGNLAIPCAARFVLTP